MTREDRWVMSLDEIAAIRWTCGACQVSVSFPLDQTIRLPRACPACGQDAGDPTQRPEDRAADQLVQALKRLLRDERRGELSLEFRADRSRPPL